ncbi:MAG: septation protein A [Ideonella sp. MAG2]|nr:MAG: septation protein A [Ideonella sp. MAG2]
MKLLLDFLPLILFFATFKGAESNSEWASQWATQHFGMLVSGGVVGPKEAPVLLATLVVIIATLAQVAFLKLKGRKVDLMLWVSLGLVVVLGGLTVWFHNETFIKWKPSGLYWTFGLVLWFSQAVLGKNLLKSMLSAELDLPAKVWRQLNSAWVLFFGLMGLLNLWVAYTFELSTWVNFKVFGATALIFAFTIAQGLLIAKHLPEETADNGTPKA